MKNLRSFLACLLLLVAMQTFFAVPFLSIQQAMGSAGIPGWSISLFFAVVVGLLVLRYHETASTQLTAFARLLTRMSATRWLALMIVFGLALRILWFLVFPASPSSDSATYITLATGLSQGEPYHIANTWAFWPPGYPLFLSFWFMIFGPSLLVVQIVNLGLFVGTLLVVYKLAGKVADEPTARLSTLFLTFWPSYMTWAGLPAKEQVLIFIIPCTLLLFLSATRGQTVKGQLIPIVISGLLLGGATLIQPSMMLFPTVFIFTSILCRFQIPRTTGQIILLVFCMGLVVAPWTLRNYKVFDQFVLISTNSGSVLYRSNNPLATGGYTPRGEIDLSGYGELEADAMGKQLAKEWIRENPVQFFRLALQKQVRFLGDDSLGAYDTLRRGNLPVSSQTFYATKAISNAFWLIAWACIAVGILNILRRRHSMEAPLLPLLVFCFFYLYALHSIVESASKYHMPLIGIFAILASMSVYGAPGRDSHTNRDQADTGRTLHD